MARPCEAERERERETFYARFLPGQADAFLQWCSGGRGVGGGVQKLGPHSLSLSLYPHTQPHTHTIQFGKLCKRAFSFFLFQSWLVRDNDRVVTEIVSLSDCWRSGSNLIQRKPEGRQGSLRSRYIYTFVIIVCTKSVQNARFMVG